MRDETGPFLQGCSPEAEAQCMQLLCSARHVTACLLGRRAVWECL